jgi:hypothetical protein
VGDNDGPLVADQLLEEGDLTLNLVAESLDDVHGLVQPDLLAFDQAGFEDAGGHVHPELATAGEDVGRAVLIRLQEDAVTGWGGGEFVDLLLEGYQLLAGLGEKGGHALGLRAGAAGFVAHFGKLAFQLANLQRCIEELAPQYRRLLFELFDVHLQLADFLLECGDPAIELR